MLWGAIGHNQVLGPVIFQGLGPGRGNGITAQRYMDQVLHPHVLPFFQAHGNWWQLVLFSDESRFLVKPRDGRIRVWRRPGEQLADDAVQEVTAFGGGSIMPSDVRHIVNGCDGLPASLQPVWDLRDRYSLKTVDFLRPHQALGDKPGSVLGPILFSLEKANIKEILVGDAKIPCAESVRDLGLTVDSELTMVPHINKVTKNCFYFLRILGKLRPFLSLPAANSIALALVMSRVDYCNSALWGLPVAQISRLQRIQNTAARIVSRTKVTDHITPVLKALHWLPVQQRIDHKVLSLTYCCIHNTAPTYLKELIPVYQPARNSPSAAPFN
nr:hypothetical protein BaRGS_033842 [Batillaria attramentaria]